MLRPHSRSMFALIAWLSACQSSSRQDSSTLTICGTNELQNVEGAVLKAPWQAELLARLQGSIVAIADKSGAYCSGSLVAEDVVLTAHHCVDWRKSEDLKVIFNYQLLSDGVTQAPQVEFDVLRIIETGYQDVDYALIRLKKNAKGQPAGAIYPIVSINPEPVPIGTDIMLIQHPKGEPKKVDSGHVTADQGQRLLYNDLDNQAGSSGGPIFNLKGEVVAIHTNGGCEGEKGANKGYKMLEIFKVSPFLNTALVPPLSTELPGAIPDNSSLGVRYLKTMPDIGPVTALKVSFRVDHKFFKDLTLTLVSPSGKRVTLRDRGSDGQVGLTEMSFPDLRTPLDSFEQLKGEASGGEWQLIVADRGKGRVGTLIDWQLSLNP